MSPLGTAMVTGAGQRLGRAIAQGLAAQGYAVAIHCYRSRAEADDIAATICKTGGKSHVVSANLADVAALPLLMAQARDALGPLTLLVNNAARFEPDEASTFDPLLWDQHFSINLRAPVLLSQAFVRQLPHDREGAIINIIDQRVLKLTPHFFSYTLAKSALWTATQTMAQAFAPNVRVNAIGPGPTLRNPRQSEADFNRQAKAIPLARAVSPQAIADAVVYLAGARSITGQLLAVDGGQHLAWQTGDAVGLSE
jgi:NAD(P)-dependent dehydrogenase (short-subunit alcohol dehydrogenase family)